jgi:hypothetical protein
MSSMQSCSSSTAAARSKNARGCEDLDRERADQVDATDNAGPHAHARDQASETEQQVQRLQTLNAAVEDSLGPGRSAVAGAADETQFDSAPTDSSDEEVTAREIALPGFA